MLDMLERNLEMTTMRNKGLGALLVAFAFAFAFGLTGLAGQASAALYGDFMDPAGTVAYENVRDNNGLFGAPNVSLNSIDFTPTNYEAQCSQCPGGATTTDILMMDIQAVPGQQISELQVNEGLDYSLQSFDPSGFASFIVTANMFIDIVEINQASVNNISATVPVVFSPSSTESIFGFGVESGVVTGTSGVIDIAGIIAAAGATGEATRVSISFDNTLQVFHDGSGGQASLRKRDTNFVSMTINGGAPVPEPGTALLLMGGLAALAGRKRAA